MVLVEKGMSLNKCNRQKLISETLTSRFGGVLGEPPLGCTFMWTSSLPFLPPVGALCGFCVLSAYLGLFYTLDDIEMMPRSLLQTQNTGPQCLSLKRMFS